MKSEARWRRIGRTACIIVATAGFGFGFGAPAAASAQSNPSAEDIRALAQQLTQLSPTVSHLEANQLARVAHLRTGELKREYGAVRSPHLHNFLVNAGFKRRGLCHHWARDLGGQLASLNLRTMQLRWGIARGGTLREHNAVVVTARGQPFERGIVLDGWRHSGRLFSGPVEADKYPWTEDPADSFVSAARRKR